VLSKDVEFRDAAGEHVGRVVAQASSDGLGSAGGQE